jgi:uncharacterized membrane-anchored protein
MILKPLHIIPLLLVSTLLHAAQPTAEQEAEFAKKLESRLKFKTGEIVLPGGLAKLHLPPEFHYLDPKDADFVLTKLWGNPPGSETLGMIFPTNSSPVAEDGWGIVITYSDDGYIKDADADSINYDKLMKDMQKGAAADNKEREKQGFGAVELVGWAARPHYDKATHKMYWAKELKFSGSPENTLNYNIRVLGRGGVLNLNAVAKMGALPMIEKATPEIVGLVDFIEGNRYADFNASTDKVAAYGLAALVAGGLAAKAGFFKVLIAALIAGKKFVIIGVIALVAILKKFVFGRGRTET